MVRIVAETIERRSVDSLVPYAANSRTHSEEQVAQLAAAMREFGFTNPVLIDEHGGLIAGHGRVMAAKVVGLAEVPCIVLSGLTPAQRRAYVIADNKLALNAGWDEAMLRSEIAALTADGFDLGLLGFGDDLTDLMDGDLLKPEKDPDAAPSLPAAPFSRLGDVWRMGSHRVCCGDAESVSTWADFMQGRSADLCWTDPPYNVDYESKSAGKIKNDKMTGDAFRKLLGNSMAALHGILKPGASIYVAHADIEGYNFRSAFLAAGFKLSGCLIWKKDSLVLGRSDFQWMHEPILYGWKLGRAHRWYGGRKLTTVQEWVGDPVKKLDDGTFQIVVGDQVLRVSGDATLEESPSSIFFHEKPRRSAEHPTMKPVALIERMLRCSGRSGDLVVDAFGGSGSTLIAAERLGMLAWLMELDPKFVDVIVRRWEEYSGEQAYRESDGAHMPASETEG